MTVCLSARGVCIDAPGGRTLFDDLHLSLELGDRVALVGRNGVGKSTLLEVLAGGLEPTRGHVARHPSRCWVSQGLADASSPDTQSAVQSPGERRRAALVAAFDARPALLLLDEPTRDLDEASVEWLLGALSRFSGALVVVSHDRRVLCQFEDFFVAAESGARHQHGTWRQVVEQLEVERQLEEQRYGRRLEQLAERERLNDVVARRRAQKKNLGRLHELKRCPARAQLNGKRGYAQVSQGRRALLQEQRITQARHGVQTARRALAVNLPLHLQPPALPEPSERPLIELDHVSAVIDGRPLFSDISLRLGRERLAVRGPNGSGKSTLVEIMSGQRLPDVGRAWCDTARVGYVAQNAANWQTERTLVELLREASFIDIDECARCVRAHRFPLGLAERSLATLSPGERVRAALIVLFERKPAPELLILDEPTDALDLVGLAAFERTLVAWPGGLVLVSHDRELLRAVQMHDQLVLG